MFNWGFTLRTTLTPQPCVVGFSLPSCVLVPFADAIATACNNRYYIHFVLYKSPGCTTLTPQPCVVGFSLPSCVLVPFADAIATACNNRYYIHFVLYKSPGVPLKPATLRCGVSFISLPYRTILATATNSCLFSKSRYGIFIV